MTEEERSGSANEDDASRQSQADNDDDSREESQDRQTSSEEVRRVRSEAKNLRSRLREAERERDDLRKRTQTDDERKSSDLSRAQGENERLKSQVQSLLVQVAATRVGIVDPDAAARLLDWEGLDLDDSNELEKRLKKLVREREWLLGKSRGGSDGGAGGTGDQPLSMNDLIRQRAGVSMLPDE